MPATSRERLDPRPEAAGIQVTREARATYVLYYRQNPGFVLVSGTANFPHKQCPVRLAA